MDWNFETQVYQPVSRANDLSVIGISHKAFYSTFIWNISQPIWVYDDLDRHFQETCLQFTFPLAICSTSFFIILVWTIAYTLRARRTQQHQKQNDVDEEDLVLRKSTSNFSTFSLDQPKAQAGIVVFETSILCTQLAFAVAALIKDDQIETRAAITYIILWSYLISLTLLRLYFTAAQRPLPFLKLWNHCAVIYGLEWLCETMVFRSALIHPQSSLSRSLITIRFALSTTLVIIVLVSRRGNRGILMEDEDNIEPSREPLASLLGRLTFAWSDSLIWCGFKRPLDMLDVWNVAPQDKAERVMERFRQVKKTHILAVHLLLFFKKQILLQGLWCAVSSVAMFMPTLLLKAILDYLEDPSSTSTNAAWFYAMLLFVSGIVQAVADGQLLWIGRKTCIQIRAVVIGEIYSKSLLRKASVTAEKEEKKSEDRNSKPLPQKVQSWKTKHQTQARAAPGTVPADVGNGTHTQASNGTVINLMSIDSFKVAEVSAYLHSLWAATPIQLTIAVALLYKVLGSSSFAGIIITVLILPWNMWIAKSFSQAQKAIMAATDARIHSTNEVLQNIRIIKYFAWEQRFLEQVNEKRQKELNALWRKYILWAAAFTIWGGLPILITFASFFIFTKVEKKPLVPSIAFPALSMFSLLRVPLDQLADMVAHVQESKVSVDRVEKFLAEEETEKYLQLDKVKQSLQYEVRIALEHATLSWSATENPSKANGAPFRLTDMNVNFVIGKLNVIAGPTGCGKTSLLMALLGEMQLLEGSVYLPGGYSRQHRRPDPEIGLTESVAYCAQQAWLVNATIRENILFATPFNARRYKAVVAACALERDLEILDAGDRTLVGEKGIALSGGQKQRISLARALYSDSKHVLLDDVLSAVDSHTARHIFDHALMGPLMQHRTCILVSHNIALTVPQARHVVVLRNGEISIQGSPLQVMESGQLGEEMAKSVPVSRLPSEAPSRVPSPPMDQILNKVPSGATVIRELSILEETQIKADPIFVDPRTETKATGSVGWSTIKMYLQAMGPWYYWIFAGLAFIAVQVGSVATNLWIRQWANAYHKSSANQDIAYHSLQTQTPSHKLSGGLIMPVFFTTLDKLQQDPALYQMVDSTFYLGVYAAIGAAYIVTCFSRELLLFAGSLRASRILHKRLLSSVLRGTFLFFDSTPLGQLTNRFSRDLQAIDQEVSPVALGLLNNAASVLTIVILISAITPGFLLPGVFIAIIYTVIGTLYIHSSRDLKRLESVQRSPLLQHFGETLSGIVTIRAYGVEARFIDDSNKKINTYNRPFIYLWATNRWLGFRVDCTGALVSFFSALFIIRSVGSIDAGAAGLSLTYAITFTQNVLWLVRLYATNEQNMNSVERVQEYINIDQEVEINEADTGMPKTNPPTDWPSQGIVQFVNYSTRYRKDLDPVLRNVTFKILASEKVGVVGRTGAGKSSLALALFRGLKAEAGNITIDDIDISLVGLQQLREAITIVPQDPTLFTGTVRSNLDPFNHFTDEQIYAALKRVQLISRASQHFSESLVPRSPSIPSSASVMNGADDLLVENDDIVSTIGISSSDATLIPFTSKAKRIQNIFHNLNAMIAESGSNLSQGQRQLLCLARALLKSPKVLIMDEATASIDYATDSKIHETLRELNDTTIITIAHRLQTIIDYDKVLVLDRGQVIEFAHPWELLQKKEGSFRAMCETSGDLEILLDLAKSAWESKRLIDV